MKRVYSLVTLEEAMQLVPADRLTRWQLDADPRQPSDTIQDYLRRLRVFDLDNSEAAKLLLIDALFAEIVPNHQPLKVWKAMALETDTLTGIADYVFSPDYAFLKTPLLCVAEAKRDDFVQGRAQCIAEMVACDWKNRQQGIEIDIYGIVSNGQGWVFYKMTTTNAVFETELYSISDLPKLLGALDMVCAACAQNIPNE
jgi:hypothetical protein